MAHTVDEILANALQSVQIWDHYLTRLERLKDRGLDAAIVKELCISGPTQCAELVYWLTKATDAQIARVNRMASA